MLIGRRQAVQGLVVFTGVGCKPNAELPHKAKREAKPRAAAPTKSASGLVEISALDPTIRLDIRYATPNNFTGMTLSG
jgi:zinc D-Ala-D-Ala dipeptidase